MTLKIIKRLLLVAISALLINCDNAQTKDEKTDQEATHYQVIEIDKEGCVKYKIDGEVSLQVIIYEQQSGEYTTNKKNSICR